MARSPRPSVSVIVPVFNSSESLVELADRLGDVLPACTSAYEIIFVDDGSGPDTWRAIRRLCAAHDAVRGIALARNFGQHNALLAGIADASMEVVVTMDDDLQHRPEEIPALLAAFDDDVDLVYGYPASGNHPAWRNVSSRITKAALGRALGHAFAEHASAFRLFSAELVPALTGCGDPYVSIDVLLSWATNRVTAVPVPMDERRYGRSNYSFGKLVRHAVNMLTGYSTAPLRAVAWCGFAFAAFGAALLVYVLGTYAVLGRTVPGFTFLASFVAIASGVQMTTLGVIGEYLGRMHVRSMHRPVYRVRETARGDRVPDAGPPAVAAVAAEPRGEAVPPGAGPGAVAVTGPAASGTRR